MKSNSFCLYARSSHRRYSAALALYWGRTLCLERRFDIDLFGSEIRRSRRSGFVFPNDASIVEQCLCMHRLDLSMGMDDDRPMSMADGISHFLFNIKYFFRTVEIA